MTSQRGRIGLVGAVLMLCIAARLVDRISAIEPPSAALPLHPRVVASERTAVTFPGRHVVISSRTFDDEFAAYAHASELRGRLRDAATPFVAVDRLRSQAAVKLELPNDLMTAIPMIARLRQYDLPPESDWFIARTSDLDEWKQTSALCEQLYGRVPRRGPYQPRRRSNVVADILAVAEGFGVPLYLFSPRLGPDDLPALPAVWKRAPEAQDVVLLRRPPRYLTANRDSVRWQEVQRALLRAHDLLASYRTQLDRLPAHLRPSGDLQDEVQPTALFTYAAVLVSDLAQKAAPNDKEALAAYMEGPRDETVRHDVGIRRAALYARQALAHAYFVTLQFVTGDSERDGSQHH